MVRTVHENSTFVQPHINIFGGNIWCVQEGEFVAKQVIG